MPSSTSVYFNDKRCATTGIFPGCTCLDVQPDNLFTRKNGTTLPSRFLSVLLDFALMRLPKVGILLRCGDGHDQAAGSSVGSLEKTGQEPVKVQLRVCQSIMVKFASLNSLLSALLGTSYLLLLLLLAVLGFDDRHGSSAGSGNHGSGSGFSDTRI